MRPDSLGTRYSGGTPRRAGGGGGMSTIGNPSAFTKRCDTCHPGAGGPWRAPIGMTPAPISPPPAGRVMSATCRPYSSSGAPVAPRLCGVFGPECKHKSYPGVYQTCSSFSLRRFSWLSFGVATRPPDNLAHKATNGRYLPAARLLLSSRSGQAPEERRLGGKGPRHTQKGFPENQNNSFRNI